MSETPRAKLVGVNHIALEVGDLEEALDFYARVFQFELRGRAPKMAFIDMGDQFLALSEGRRQAADDSRHFGLVVDDRRTVRAAAEAAGATLLPGRGLDFLDPWGNHIQVVEYRDVQFSKTAGVLRQLAVDPAKTDEALQEAREKGMAS
jgi:catechol 2,3-dioxygenase-like lactoylglutathione lyase family enzyme